MNYKELQEHIDSLKPMLRNAEERYLSPLQELDVVRKLDISRSKYKGLIHKARKLNYESMVSGIIHFQKSMSPYHIAYMAFNIAMSLSWNDLRIPTHDEMEMLLEYAGHTGDEILDHQGTYSVNDLRILPHPEKASIVFFLSKIIFDALSMKDFEKLRQVDAKLVEMDILKDYSDRKSFWEEFAIKGIDHYVEQAVYLAIQDELEKVIDEKTTLLTAVHDHIEAETLASIDINPLNPGIRAYNGDTFLDEEVRKKREAYSDTRADMGEIIARVVDDLDELKLKLAVEKQELFDHVDSLSVAGGFYAALLSGDELAYIPAIHVLLNECHIRQSFPGLAMPMEPLADEDVWCYEDTSCNGRKASNVYGKEDSIGVSFCVNAKDEGNPDYETFMIPIRSFVAELSGSAVPESIDVRMSIVNRLKEYGYSARKARDIAVAIATLRAKNMLSRKEDRLAILKNLYPENKAIESREDVLAIDRLKAKIEDLEGRLKISEKEKKGYRHEIVSLEKQIAELNDRHEREIDQILKDTQFEAEQEELQVSDIEYPYHTEKKITLYGGFDVFHRELSKLMPDIKIVEPCYKSPNLDVFRNSDMVFIQPNKLNHGNYFSVRDAAKHADVPYYHLRFACARKCADFMVGAIEAAEMKE